MACCSVAPALAHAAPRTPPVTVAVLDLRAVDTDPHLAEALLDVVTEEVGRVPDTRALSRKEIAAMVSEEMRKQMLGCSDSSCLAELGDALNAQMLVTGEVARVGANTLLTLQLINHRFASVMNRVSLTWPGPSDGLTDVARAATQMLMLTREQKRPASLEVVDAPGGASVFVDEAKVAGRSLPRVDLGVHMVRITASGHEDRTFPVVVGNGATVRVSGRLVSIPLYRRPWFWLGSLGGVGAVAVLTAVVVGVVPLSILVFNTGGARVQTRQRAPALGEYSTP